MTTAFIAFGGNLGEVRASFDAACAMLGQACTVLARSNIYQTPALLASSASPAQPDYLNAVVKVSTTLSASALLEFLHTIEAKHARKRLEHWGARTLDLDLLAFGDMLSDQPSLMLPHPQLHKRMFVLQPWADIQPDWLHPVLQRHVRCMLQDVQGKNTQGFEGMLWTNNK